MEKDFLYEGLSMLSITITFL